MEEEVKQCSKCKRILPYNNFRWRNKAQGKLHSQCKDCEKERDKQHYKESLERQQKILGTAIQQKARNQEIIEDYKTCGCQKCGDQRSYVLDFHHKDKKLKENQVSYLAKSASVENLIKEIEKCVVLCSNCHREFHYLEKTQNMTLEEYLSN